MQCISIVCALCLYLRITRLGDAAYNRSDKWAVGVYNPLSMVRAHRLYHPSQRNFFKTDILTDANDNCGYIGGELNVDECVGEYNTGEQGVSATKLVSCWRFAESRVCTKASCCRSYKYGYCKDKCWRFTESQVCTKTSCCRSYKYGYCKDNKENVPGTTWRACCDQKTCSDFDCASKNPKTSPTQPTGGNSLAEVGRCEARAGRCTGNTIPTQDVVGVGDEQSLMQEAEGTEALVPRSAARDAGGSG